MQLKVIISKLIKRASFIRNWFCYTPTPHQNHKGFNTPYPQKETKLYPPPKRNNIPFQKIRNNTTPPKKPTNKWKKVKGRVKYFRCRISGLDLLYILLCIAIKWITKPQEKKILQVLYVYSFVLLPKCCQFS